MKFSRAELAAAAVTAAVLLLIAGRWGTDSGEVRGYTVSGAHAARTASPTPSPVFVPDRVIDLNTATLDQLVTLPGVGERRAQAILDYRAANGPFAHSEDVAQVPGIGQALYRDMAAYITAGTPAPEGG